MGHHLTEITPAESVTLVKLMITGEAMYGFITALVKLSLMMLYYRLLQVSFQTSKLLRVSAYIIAAVVISSALILFFTTLLGCVPIEKNWIPSLPGRCFDQVVPWTVNSTLSIVTDAAILILPIPEIWAMRLSILEKIGVTLTLATGCVYVLPS